MAFQKPNIIGIQGSSLIVKHPDLSKYTRTTLAADAASAATSISVLDNIGFSNSDHVVIGKPGISGTESRSVNASVTRGQALVLTPGLTFDHAQDTPVYRSPEARITFFGINALGFSSVSSTVISTVDIEWAKPYTELSIPASPVYDYYGVAFLGTTGSTTTPISVISANGYNRNNVASVIEDAVKSSNTLIDGDVITWEFLISAVNEAQQRVGQLISEDGSKKHWSFQERDSLIVLPKGVRKVPISFFYSSQSAYDSGLFLTYPLLANYQEGGSQFKFSAEQLIDVTINGRSLAPTDRKEIDSHIKDAPYVTIASDVEATDTEIWLDAPYNMPLAGTFYPYSVDYSDIESALSGGDPVNSPWQYKMTCDPVPTLGLGAFNYLRRGGELTVDGSGNHLGRISSYAIDQGYIFFDRFWDGTTDKQLNQDELFIRVRYYKDLDSITNMGQEIAAPFSNLYHDFVVAKIEYVKGSKQDAMTLMGKFDEDVKKIMLLDTIETSKVDRYYRFVEPGIYRDKITQTNF
jgi:hypothetical protein